MSSKKINLIFWSYKTLFLHDIGAAVEPAYHLVEEADGDSD